MSENNTPEEFASVLIQHAKGRAHDEASKRLTEAVEAVKQLRKPAKVTVELTIHPVAKIPNAFRIEDKVTAKIPEDPRSSMWFADDTGALYRNDPNQRSLYDTEDTEPADGKTAAAGNN